MSNESRVFTLHLGRNKGYPLFFLPPKILCPEPSALGREDIFSAVYKIQNVAGIFTLNGDNNNTEPISSVYKSFVPSDFYCPIAH